MKVSRRVCLNLLASTGAVAMAAGTPALAQNSRKPNIVVMLMDNLGYGELGVYGGGILRGAATPTIDKLASEGMRLLNFNVEAQCTPSRSAFLTGRFSIRSGTYEVPVGGVPDGLTQWEVTLAQLLSQQGYATGMWGKWHLGSTDARLPTNRGFDEWYGIPRTYDEGMWPSLNETNGMWPSVGNTQGWNAKTVAPEPIYDARKDEKPKRIGILDVDRRRTMEAEITNRAVDFIKRNATAAKPFFAYVSFSLSTCRRCLIQISRAKRATGIGRIVWRRWIIAPAKFSMRLSKRGLKTTRWSSSPVTTARKRQIPGRETVGLGAAHTSRPWRPLYERHLSSAGPVKCQRVASITKSFTSWTTLAHVGGAEVPKDRPIDGVDQLDFFLGKQDASNREGFPAYVADRLSAVKWRNWKVHLIKQDSMYDIPQRLALPRIINLLTDLKEERDVAAYNTWVAAPVLKIVSDFEASLKKYPPIKLGTPDPYTPPQ